MVREREFETAVAWIGLELSFMQRHLSIAALYRDKNLQAMTGGGRGLQFRPFARGRIRLIEFTLAKKNAGQIILRRIGKRIQLNRLTSLVLRLIEFTQINNDAC